MYLKYGLNICFDVINVYRVIELLSLIKNKKYSIIILRLPLKYFSQK